MHNQRNAKRRIQRKKFPELDRKEIETRKVWHSGI
jgi:hypothetical protein